MTMRAHIGTFVLGALSSLILTALVGLGFVVSNAITGADVDDSHSLEQIAAEFDVTIVWSVTACKTEATGCFLSVTPDLIYVNPDLSEGMLRYVVKHELGHVVQYRLGLPNDECAADKFAASLGSDYRYYC